MLYKKYLLVLAVFALFGCSSINDARKAQKGKNLLHGEKTVTSSDLGLTEKATLTLDRAVEIALKYHPSIVQSNQNYIIADKQFSDAFAGYLPSVSASGSYSRATSNSTAGEEKNDSSKSYSGSASISQLVYDFGKTPASIRQSYENKVSAESSFKSARNNVTYNTYKAYHDLLKQQALLNISEETEKQYKIYLEETKSLVEVGKRIKYDITKAEVNLGNAQITLVSAINGVMTARAVLNNALGLAEEPGYLVEEPRMREITQTNIASLFALAKENQPDLAGSRSGVKAASAYIDQAIADLFPSLSLSGSYTKSGDEFPLVWNWSLRSLLSITLFSGGEKINQINKATASLRIARAKLAQAEQSVYLELSRAISQLEESRQRYAIADLVVRQAEENRTLAEERYKLGKASSIELTDALVSLSDARVKLIQAKFDYQTAVALINKETGVYK
jgi:TolC family type I secretion outer membrane protein